MKHFSLTWRLLGLLALLLLARLVGHAQNVGIGTTNPTQTLDVNGNLRVRGASGTGGRLLQADAAGLVGPAPVTYPATGSFAPVLASTSTGLNNPLVAVSGALAVVLNRGAGTLSLYDVSNPAAVVLRGTYSGITNGTSLVMSGTTVAVLNNTGAYPISVFALGTGAPVLVSTITMPAATSGQYAGLAMVGPTLYAMSDHAGGNYGYFYVYDLSSPAAPVLRNGAANSTTGFFTPTYIAAAGTLACVSAPYGSTAAADHFNVIDVSNPATPVVVGTNGGNVAGNFTYQARPLAMVPGVVVTLQPENNLLSTYDLSTPASPTLRNTFITGTTPVSVALSGMLAYVACRGSNTLQVLDLSGSTAVLRGTATLDANANSVAATSTVALAANASAANDLQAFSLPTRSVAVNTDGSVTTVPTASGTDFIQNQTATAQAGGFRVSGSGTVGGTLAVGTSTAPGQVLTPTTGTHNMLAVAYGQLGGSPFVTSSTSGNYSAVRTSTGSYVITFTSASGLSGLNFDGYPVVVALYGSSLTGFIGWDGGPGVINVKTYNSSGVLTDRMFTFTAFAP